MGLYYRGSGVRYESDARSLDFFLTCELSLLTYLRDRYLSEKNGIFSDDLLSRPLTMAVF